MQLNSVFLLSSLLVLTLGGCKKDSDNPAAQPKTIAYKADGRSVKVSDLDPLVVDFNEDGQVDYVVFAQLSANQDGDHLYFGINPIGSHFVKSGPEDENHFLNMGFVIEENTNALISETLGPEQFWTDAHSTLAVRHTKTNNEIWYEGSWHDEWPAIVGVKLVFNGQVHFGWMRMQFNKTAETMTLVEYAYNTTADGSIVSGDH